MERKEWQTEEDPQENQIDSLAHLLGQSYILDPIFHKQNWGEHLQRKQVNLVLYNYSEIWKQQNSVIKWRLISRYTKDATSYLFTHIYQMHITL